MWHSEDVNHAPNSPHHRTLWLPYHKRQLQKAMHVNTPVLPGQTKWFLGFPLHSKGSGEEITPKPSGEEWRRLRCRHVGATIPSKDCSQASPPPPPAPDHHLHTHLKGHRKGARTHMGHSAPTVRQREQQMWRLPATREVASTTSRAWAGLNRSAKWPPDLGTPTIYMGPTPPLDLGRTLTALSLTPPPTGADTSTDQIWLAASTPPPSPTPTIMHGEHLAPAAYRCHGIRPLPDDHGERHVRSRLYGKKDNPMRKLGNG
jgi:hypothetical protein